MHFSTLLTFFSSLLLLLVSADSISTTAILPANTTTTNATWNQLEIRSPAPEPNNIAKHTLPVDLASAPDPSTQGHPPHEEPGSSPPASQRLHRIQRRDFIGGTNTHNPEPCASKCRDSKILNCSAATYIFNPDNNVLQWKQVHTWRCFCSDGAMCMGCMYSPPRSRLSFPLPFFFLFWFWFFGHRGVQADLFCSCVALRGHRGKADAQPTLEPPNMITGIL